MKNKIIEKYIQFAIDNGYKNNIKIGFTNPSQLLITDGKAEFISNMCSEIMSRNFIEAIARGIIKKYKWDKDEEIYYTGIKNNKDLTLVSIDELIDNIRSEQAIAIYENKLEDFITNLLNLGNAK